MEGMPAREGGGTEGLVPLDGERAERRQLAWHTTLHPKIRPEDHETWGSCLFNQGRPRTRGVVGACKT